MKKFCFLLLFLTVCLPALSVAEEGKCVAGDCVNGKGTMIWPDDSRYEGQWKNGRMEGEGTLFFSNNKKYRGGFKDDKFNGRGVLSDPDGASYEGEWRSSRMHGRGILTFPDGKKYKGEFRNGKRDGRGILTNPDGTYYDGQWKDDRAEGQGTMTFRDGSRYVGQFREGQRHGRGKYTWASGNSYDGQWEEGKRRGQGIEYAADGSIKKQGTWMNMGFGAYLTGGGGWNPDLRIFRVSSTTMGGGLLLDTNLLGSGFNYRLKLGVDRWRMTFSPYNINDNPVIYRTCKLDLPRFHLTNDFGLGLRTTKSSKLWLGMQIGFGAGFRGKTTWLFSGSLGPVLGVNFLLTEHVFLAFDIPLTLSVLYYSYTYNTIEMNPKCGLMYIIPPRDNSLDPIGMPRTHAHKYDVAVSATLNISVIYRFGQ